MTRAADNRGKGDYQIDYAPAPRITEADKTNDRKYAVSSFFLLFFRFLSLSLKYNLELIDWRFLNPYDITIDNAHTSLKP